MSLLLGLEDIAILIVAALLPALLYLTWVRNTEVGIREAWGTVLGAFLYGAFFATVTAALIEAALVAGGTSFSQAYPAPEFVFLNGGTTAGALFLVLVIAPFVEEGLKAIGVTRYAGSIRVVADGPVIGAGVGLGFGFFETFLYGLGAFLTGGIEAGLLLIIVRSLSSVLLHGSSTALFGYGYAESRVGAGGHAAASHYFGAVGLHSVFNAVVSLGTFVMILGLGADAVSAAQAAGFVLGILLAFLAIEYIRRLIAQSSYPGALATHPRYRPPPVRSPAPPRGRYSPPRP
jgi:RsiW-degrading membrane proteinase PrsW (M82 family)